MFRRRAKKDRTEKEDEQIEHQVKPAPKVKPPRYDRRNKRLTDKDPDLDKKDKDLSMNYKDIGGSETALDEAICLVAMRFRGVSPDLEDVNTVREALGSVDLTDAELYPAVASAVLSHIDAKYKHARLRRVMPSADKRRFEMGPPLEPRDTTHPLWPVFTKVAPFKPAAVTEDDLVAIIAAAKKRIDKALYKYNRDCALREALDMTLATLSKGKYEHMLDAPTYLGVLTRMTNSDIDLTKDTYVPTEVDTDLKYLQDTPFDPYEWWGKPVEPVAEDVHKNDAWKKHFEHAGPYVWDDDEPYMETLSNPTV